MGITFSELLILYQFSFSPQVKRSVIISNKHGIYELPNHFRLRILGKIRKISKTSQTYNPATSPRPLPPKKKQNCRYQQQTAEKKILKFSLSAGKLEPLSHISSMLPRRPQIPPKEMNLPNPLLTTFYISQYIFKLV